MNNDEDTMTMIYEYIKIDYLIILLIEKSLNLHYCSCTDVKTNLTSFHTGMACSLTRISSLFF